MTKFYTAEGEEVEAFTAEEIKTHPEFVKLQESLTVAEKKAAEASGNPDQKERLKKQAEEAKNTLELFKEEMSKKFEALSTNFVSGIKEKAVAKLSKGDKDVAEKIQLKYQALIKTGEYVEDEAGITRAMADAATLVQGSRPAPSFMDNLTSAGGSGYNGVPNGGSASIPDSAKGLGKALGITEEDYKKYGDKIK